jgi:hypothetical protein
MLFFMAWLVNCGGFMLRFEEDSENRTLIVIVSGYIEKENIDAYIHHLNRRLNDWKTIKIVKIIDNFEGIDFKSFMRVLKVYLWNLKKFEKCALITHNLLSGWQGFLGAFFAGLGHLLALPLVCKFKRFSFNKMEQAKVWIKDDVALKENNA